MNPGDSPTGRSVMGPGLTIRPYLGQEELGQGMRGMTEEAEAVNDLADLEHQDLIYNLNCFNELNGIIESAEFSGRIAAGS